MQQLKILRQLNNHTQQFVADSLGVSRPTYARYESGEREPNISAIIKLASFYDVSIDFLLDFKPNSAPDSGTDDAFSQLIATLSDEDKDNVMRYIEFIQKRKNT